MSRKDETTASKMAAATAMCRVSDLHLQHDWAPSWRALAKRFETRPNEDHVRAIRELGAPASQVADLSVWQLERLAYDELRGGDIALGSGDVAVIHDESKQIQRRLRRVLRHGAKCRAQREQLAKDMAKQREGLIAELAKAKECLAQTYAADMPDEQVLALTTPAPVEQRLRGVNGKQVADENEAEVAEEVATVSVASSGSTKDKDAAV